MGRNKSNKIGHMAQMGFTKGEDAGGHERLGDRGGDVHIIVQSEGLDITPPSKFRSVKIAAEDIESIEFSQADEQAARATLTRMGVGTVLLPGIGTMIGFMAKKKKVRTQTLALVTVDSQPIVLLIEGNEFKARTIFSALADKVSSPNATAEVSL